jgi:hypothetical protein
MGGTASDMMSQSPSTPKLTTSAKASQSPATPGSRKRRRVEKEDVPQRRLKRFRAQPPQTVMVKYDRVMTQRMFMVERSGRIKGALNEEFSVLGSTGNVYVVTLNQIPSYTSRWRL